MSDDKQPYTVENVLREILALSEVAGEPAISLLASGGLRLLASEQPMGQEKPVRPDTLPRVQVHSSGEWHVGEDYGGFFRAIGPARANYRIAQADAKAGRETSGLEAAVVIALDALVDEHGGADADASVARAKLPEWFAGLYDAWDRMPDRDAQPTEQPQTVAESDRCQLCGRAFPASIPHSMTCCCNGSFMVTTFAEPHPLPPNVGVATNERKRTTNPTRVLPAISGKPTYHEKVRELVAASVAFLDHREDTERPATAVPFMRWRRAVEDMRNEVQPMADAKACDPLHPVGRCTCVGEGLCEWCRRTIDLGGQ